MEFPPLSVVLVLALGYSYFNGLMWCGALIPYVSLKSVTHTRTQNVKIKLSISYSGYKCYIARTCINKNVCVCVSVVL